MSEYNVHADIEELRTWVRTDYEHTPVTRQRYLDCVDRIKEHIEEQHDTINELLECDGECGTCTEGCDD